MNNYNHRVSRKNAKKAKIKGNYDEGVKWKLFTMMLMLLVACCLLFVVDGHLSRTMLIALAILIVA